MDSLEKRPSLLRLDAQKQLRYYPQEEGQEEEPDMLLFLPGFGRPGSDLKEQLPNLQPSIGIDLPFISEHWINRDFRPTDIRALCLQLQTQYRWRSIHLLGHSLGARVWLKSLPLLLAADLPIDSVTLVAPDGLGGRYTGWLDRLPAFCFPWLERFLQQPARILRLGDFLFNRKLIDPFTYQYLQQHLREEQYQRLLLGTLRSVIHFRIDATDCNCFAKATKPRVIVGHKDPIIRPVHIQQRLGSLPNVETLTFKGGHYLPKELLYSLYGKQLREEP